MAIKTVVAVINGPTYNLTLNASTGKYEATITPNTVDAGASMIVSVTIT